MASTIILSDNGASSGSAGIKTTGGNDGTLVLQTTTSGGTATTAVTIGTDQSVTFAQAANLPNTFGFKNRIINGAFTVNQYNSGTSVSPTATQYTIDRWNAVTNIAGGAKYSTQQTPNTTETGYATRVGAGFQNYFAITSLGAYSVSSGDIAAIQQVIEGNNIADLSWGTSSAKTVTLSFWVYSSLTGTFGGAVRQGSGTRSYPFTYTISSTNTWTQISVTISGDTSGTYASNNTAGLIVSFGLGVGSTFSGSAGSWQAGNYITATGATNVISTNGATFYITGVQLEKGSTATSFDYRPYGTELALCQRYYQTYNAGTWGFPTFLTFVPNGDTRGGFTFPVTMRAAPTITFSNTNWNCIGSGDAGAAINVSPTVSASGVTVNGFGIVVSNPSVFSPASTAVCAWGTNANITYYATAEL